MGKDKYRQQELTVNPLIGEMCCDDFTTILHYTIMSEKSYLRRPQFYPISNNSKSNRSDLNTVSAAKSEFKPSVFRVTRH